MELVLRLLRNLFTLALIAAVAVLFGGLIYLNQIGFPGQYGEWVRNELSKRGVEVEFESLRFSLRKGLVATNAQFFTKQGDPKPSLTADSLAIDIDKSLALRGQFKLREIFVTGGEAFIELEDDEKILATKINAEVFIRDEERLQIRKASCFIAGLHVSLDADLTLPQKKEPDGENKRPVDDKILRAVLKELARWKFPEDHPPQISLKIWGDLNELSRIRTEFEIDAHDLVRNNYAVGSLSLRGELRENFATIEEIFLADDSGEVEGEARWNIKKRQGRFELTSSIDIKNFLASSLDSAIMEDLSYNEPPYVQIKGEIVQQPDQKLSMRTRGFVDLGPFHFLEHRYDSLQSKFSWNDGNLFLQDLEVGENDKSLTGDLLLEGDLVRYRVKSNLPLTAFSPFIKQDSPTDGIISRFQFDEESTLAIELEGHLNRTHFQGVSAKGSMRSSRLTYRGMSLHELSADFVLNPTKIEFSNVKARLDDRQEKARLRFKAPTSGPISVDRIQVDLNSQITYVSNLQGTFWPTPIVRAFAPNTAQYLEQTYRFHRPPTLTLTGAFSGYQSRPEDTHFLIALRTSGQTDYPFLGGPLPAQDLRADITMEGLNLKIERLSFAALQGLAAGQIKVQIRPDQPDTYQGDIRWNEISFPALSKIYRFEKVEKGTLKGRIQFNGAGGDIRSLNAKGSLELENGNLVSLPVLGPLSPLMAGILGDKRMGYERAKNGQAQFEITNGVWKTGNFLATSENIVLTGNGWVDLKTMNMDMTVRANVRGLLGIIALPLTPFQGLFQFRGSGQFTKPQWQAATFTAPVKGKIDPIFQKTKR
ncbi:MAG: AsmA-like C-terminal region-containing protein [Akkermansiaceae bacterium]